MAKITETYRNDEVLWVEITGVDFGTGIDFECSEVYGVTDDSRILDCDGIPLTEGDLLEIAVKNTLNI